MATLGFGSLTDSGLAFHHSVRSQNVMTEDLDDQAGYPKKESVPVSSKSYRNHARDGLNFFLINIQVKHLDECAVQGA